MLELINCCMECPKFLKYWNSGEWYIAECEMQGKVIYHELEMPHWYYDKVVHNECPMKHQNLVYRLNDGVKYKT